jgi:hypothetical protein
MRRARWRQRLGVPGVCVQETKDLFNQLLAEVRSVQAQQEEVVPVEEDNRKLKGVGLIPAFCAVV